MYYNVFRLLETGEFHMAAFGVITLILTAYMLIFYAYMFRNTDNDVSFFLSVGIISFVMNLCTNAGGVFELCYMYLGIDVLFIALGFAVNARQTISFYTSIGPWFKSTFTDTTKIGWQALSLLVAPAGIGLYFGWNKSKPELARECGKLGMWGVLLWLILLWAILGLVL